ncbi:MAG TPA: FAD-dependent oxidoreductase, partial [Kofleriaceae bacterium]|nr:FAD-dependent oxidoreductase [Kofleriaceae bacterium]
MARSALFQALRRITKKHGADASSEARGGWSRRDMLRALGAAATLPMLSACGDNVFTRTPTIAIVGGGIAGLTAAHFLAHAGVRADVYEGSMRTGGRMYTHRGLPGDQLVELGGELIDSDHVVVPLLAASFGLTLDDLVEDTAALVQDTFHFNGAVIPEATIVAQFAPVAAKMQLALAASEGTDASSVAEFERIDAMSIPEWLAEANASPLVKELLEVAYLEEY